MEELKRSTEAFCKAMNDLCGEAVDLGVVNNLSWELTEEEKGNALDVTFRGGAAHIALDSGTMLDFSGDMTISGGPWQYFHDGELHPFEPDLSDGLINFWATKGLKETKMDKLYQVFVVNKHSRKMVQVLHPVASNESQAKINAAIECQHITVDNVNDFTLIAKAMGEVPDAE